MRRDIQGKFALKNDDYRQVRSLRITDDTWKALGIASECLGMSRADYLEEIVRQNLLPCITWNKSESSPCNTWNSLQAHPSITRHQEETEKLKIQVKNLQKENSALVSKTAITFIHDFVNFESIRDHILFELKLGRQASGYKAAQKALNRLIAELKQMAGTF